jgi:oligoribonuclease NrnB/cAMP/cGMP phosphodiesterase (DHH superfamily)
MKNIDFFNGDADGIISLHQYRLFSPTDSELFTGVKRDVKLLRHCVGVKNCNLTVFDVSLLSNIEYVKQILKKKNKIKWFDHHEPGETKLGKNFSIKVDSDPNCCTNILVDKYIDGLHRPWTICGAFGDNLHEQAEKLNPCFDEQTMNKLKEIGETLNYNGYGNKESDLTVHPKNVYLDLKQYESPFRYRSKSEIYNKIYTQMKSDEKELNSSEILHETKTGKVILLPDTKASIRYSGIYSNQQTTDNPDKAFAILTLTNNDNYRISIRSPKNNPYGASKLALSFPTGGGREKAAGINELPKTELKKFIETFENIYGNE